MGGFERAGGWRSSNSALPSGGSTLHKLAFCPLTAACVYSPVLLSLLRNNGEEPTPARLTVAGKVDGRRRETWKLLPVLRTPIPHPAVIKPKICTKEDWVSDLHLLGDSESQCTIIGKTGNQPREQQLTLHPSEASPDP